MIERIESRIKDLILENVDFLVDGKSLRKGKIKVYNTKQFFIKFQIEAQNELKEFELPYPYRVVQTTNGYIFDYCLSAFCPPTEELYYKLKLLNKENASKIYNTHLHVVKLSA